jgi:hypothetical protein
MPDLSKPSPTPRHGSSSSTPGLRKWPTESPTNTHSSLTLSALPSCKRPCWAVSAVPCHSFHLRQLRSRCITRRYLAPHQPSHPRSAETQDLTNGAELSCLDLPNCIHSCRPVECPSPRPALVQQMGSNFGYLDPVNRGNPLCGCDDLGSKCLSWTYEEDDSYCVVPCWVWTGEYHLAAIVSAGVEGLSHPISLLYQCLEEQY